MFDKKRDIVTGLSQQIDATDMADGVMADCALHVLPQIEVWYVGFKRGSENCPGSRTCQM